MGCNSTTPTEQPKVESAKQKEAQNILKEIQNAKNMTDNQIIQAAREMAFKIVQKFDHNGDGNIDTEEGKQVCEEAWKYIAAIPDMSGKYDTDSKASAIEKAFNLFDANGDGSITKDEIEAGFVKLL